MVRINEDFSGDNEALKNEIKRLRSQNENKVLTLLKDAISLDLKLKEHFIFY